VRPERRRVVDEFVRREFAGEIDLFTSDADVLVKVLAVSRRLRQRFVDWYFAKYGLLTLTDNIRTNKIKTGRFYNHEETELPAYHRYVSYKRRGWHGQQVYLAVVLQDRSSDVHFEVGFPKNRIDTIPVIEVEKYVDHCAAAERFLGIIQK